MHLVLAALFAPLAWGDLLPDPQEGMQYIDHHLEVTGLPEGQVLVVAADMPEVPCVVAFTSDGEQRLRATAPPPDLEAHSDATWNNSDAESLAYTRVGLIGQGGWRPPGRTCARAASWPPPCPCHCHHRQCLRHLQVACLRC